jgi:peptide/nickel transport system ATP-binding protein
VRASATEAGELLSLTGLSVHFTTPRGVVEAVRAVCLAVWPGECVGVLGESGSGKTQLFLAAAGLLAANGRASGQANFAGADLLTMSAAERDRLRGARIGMVFQDAVGSLTPHLTVGAQLREVLRRHGKLTRAAAQARAAQLLTSVRIADPAARLKQYPFELSGGTCQRVALALALASDPQLLILDEPTSALDPTTAVQIVALLKDLQRERALAMVLITHDIKVAAALAARLYVMRAGAVIESGSTQQLLTAPRENYTRLLVETRTRELPAAPPAAGGQAALTLEELNVRYEVGHGWLGARAQLPALAGIGLTLAAGATLGVVGESGSGKSSLARAALRLLKQASGRVLWLGRDTAALPAGELRALRRHVQIVFQDPHASLEPRMRVRDILAEPLRLHAPQLDGAAREAAADAALGTVGLEPALAERYPHQLSGGQAQRVCLARALMLAPDVLVCDEPVSALDAPLRAQVLTLLAERTRACGAALLLISHDLAFVQRLTERVLVLYLGHMMELTGTAGFRHPYSRELWAAERGEASLTDGEPPSPLAPPSGCVFRTRCSHAREICASSVPAWEEAQPGHFIACHRWREL